MSKKDLKEAENRLRTVSEYYEDPKKAYQMLRDKLHHTSLGYMLFAGGNPYVMVTDSWVDCQRECYQRRVKYNTPHKLYILEVYLDSLGGGGYGYDGRVTPRGRGPDSYDNHLTSGITSFQPNIRPVTYGDISPVEYETPGDVRAYEFSKLFWMSKDE